MAGKARPIFKALWRSPIADEVERAGRAVGGRDAEYALAIMDDLRSRVTTRMHMRQFTRLTNAFSKKMENHQEARHLQEAAAAGQPLSTTTRFPVVLCFQIS